MEQRDLCKHDHVSVDGPGKGIGINILAEKVCCLREVRALAFKAKTSRCPMVIGRLWRSSCAFTAPVAEGRVQLMRKYAVSIERRW